MRRILFWALFFTAVLAFGGENFKRVALVVGNANYDVAPLANPVNDASDVSEVLSKQGFKVTKLINSDQRAMVEGIRKFGDKLDRETIALFYYVGHAVQLNGENYLIPVGAPIEREEDVEFEAVSLDRVIRAMEANNAYMNLVFLDACRDNPFLRNSRSASRGLSVVSVNVQPETAGAMIAFATAPGSTASDGDGRNGVFTQAFLKYAQEPGLEINQMLLQVRREVLRSTNGEQIPWTDISLVEEFYFAPVSIPDLVEENNSDPVSSETSLTQAQPLPLVTGAEEDEFNSKDILGWGLISAGALSSVISIISYANGVSVYDRYQNATLPGDISSIRDELNTSGGITLGFGITGLLSIGAGAVINFVLE